eukprot:TRINITY_DN5260_c0_g2_i3.p1 TRINITY_DN5260_c0_g2~~TRINITY_DN5260_c0_g2_i3.p1  ORF type:complete len:245 (+),score=27.83 TRINITY_DN5260_c0_g2_i3:101-835(+)
MNRSEATPLQPQGTNTLMRNATVEVRLSFVRKVYCILCAQMGLTIVISALIYRLGLVWVQQHSELAIFAAVSLVGTMSFWVCCQRVVAQFPMNYIVLLILTASMSVLVGITSALYTWQNLLLAATMTCATFAGMTLYAWTTSTDFTGFHPYLFVALCAMTVFGSTLTLMSWAGVRFDWAHMLYSFAGVLVFMFFIVYDTQLMLGELGGHRRAFSIDDYVAATLSLYLDIVNLFIHLLRLMGKRK